MIRRAVSMGGASLALALTAMPVLASDTPGEGVEIRPASSSIAEEQFQLQVLVKGLEELGYEVEPHMELEYPAMHLGMANGDITLNATYWDPLHKAFYENSGGPETLWLSDVFVPDSVQGYLIDKATAEKHGIKTIDQLTDPEIAKIFDVDGNGKADLTGCNPGWGCERVIEHHLVEYGLKDTVEHNQGSYFALMADTLTRFENGDPVLYYTWLPLWVSNLLAPGEDVVWLEVPYTSLPDGQKAETELTDGRNLGFAVNNQRVVANREWIEENPAAKAFLDAAFLPVSAINAQNLLMQEGEDSADDIERHAVEWIEQNRADFDSWLKAARAAAAS
jgi:glycine betaine/proline transport system substrate-binding protein